MFELDQDADMEFVNQNNATENIGIEIDRLERDVHDFTSTPNISFDNMKGLGNMLAGSSAKFLFLSAHLKVYDKLSEYVPALLRRVSIVESYLKEMNIKFKGSELDVEPVITPFVINNESEFIRFLMEVNGNKPIYSQSYSMELAGVKNPEQMLNEINEEQERVNASDLV